MNLNIELRQELFFATAIHSCDLPQFRSVVSKISSKHFKNINKQPGFPVMSQHYLDSPELADFREAILSICKEILVLSGYDMSMFSTMFTAMWTQEHGYQSAMEQHIHGGGDQLVGFYCLDAPANCGRALFHDPRPGKVQLNLPESDQSKATLASNLINYEMSPGALIVAPAWLPHSITRNLNKKSPARFVHFNVAVQYAPPVSGCCVKPEII